MTLRYRAACAIHHIDYVVNDEQAIQRPRRDIGDAATCRAAQIT